MKRATSVFWLALAACSSPSGAMDVVDAPIADTGSTDAMPDATTGSSVAIYGWVPPTGNSPCGLATNAQCSTDYATYVLPHVDGVSLPLIWSDVETTQGAYDFSSYDAQVERFLSDSNWSPTKKIVVVVTSVSNGGSNANTPAYVFTSAWATTLGAQPLHVCACASYKGDGGIPTDTCTSGGNTTGMPAVFETPFKVARESFYAQVVAHFNSVSWKASIAYIRFGVGVGGEAFPFCTSAMETIVTPTSAAQLKVVWTGYANELYTYEAGLTSSIPFMAAPNGGQNAVVGVSWADTEAADAVANHLLLGTEGLQIADRAAFMGGQPCSNNWCQTFETYTAQSAVLEMQTASPTDPTGVGPPGSLVDLLPFAVSRHGNAFELFPQDLFLTYDPNYNPATGPGYTADHAAYAAAIAGVR